MIMKKRITSKQHFSLFSKKLFFSVISIFIAFAVCFIIYQYHREKEYKIGLLNTELQDYNLRLSEKLGSSYFAKDTVDKYISINAKKELRVTIISLNGKVKYDNYRPDVANFENHILRQEVQQALKNGSGIDIRRISETTGLKFFYSATLFKHYIIRSALPYDLNLSKLLKSNLNYIWFTLIVTILLTIIFYRLTYKLGTSINKLSDFAVNADHDKAFDVNIEEEFPHNELGDISRHIIEIYKRLHKTKEALYIEREKLISHLRISHEGLGVFNSNKKEILVNNLFTQYTNQISDSNMETSEQIFQIKELSVINDFIDNNINTNRRERRMSITINKNGKTFIVECVIFQDLNFEININDITIEEEQVRLKRQLTQNIAHELKTPVSSIQGYLETIISNHNIPPEQLNQFLQRCYAQSNRLSLLLRDISTLTRMDEAANLINMEKVDLGLMVSNIVNEVSIQLEEKHITVINSLKDKMQINGNYSLLYSIFRNLMDNSISYAGTNIHIYINCFREDNEFYYFSFSDTGIGVAPEHLNRLFERFYRVDKGRSRKLGGTGLGLAIVKNAVIIHGGSISAKNAQGGGLEFIFTLNKEN